ncbi:sensor histidine kinase [Alsobacter sp. R-9]
MTLARQFALAGSMVLSVSMAVLGSWVANRIERGVIDNAVATTAIYMHSFIEPLVQDLGTSKDLSPASKEGFHRLFTETPIGRRVASIKIWGTDGTILYSKDPELIGKSYPVGEDLRAALGGKVMGSLDDLTDEENAHERAMRLPLMEIYIPMHANGTDRIIAVAEFYTSAEQLFADVNRATLQSWLIVALVTLGMAGALFGIVRRGSRTISLQQLALRDRIEELSTLLRRNEELRGHVNEARRQAADTNERLLRRIGADLHDGPAQLIGLALLRLDALRKVVQAHLDNKQEHNADIIRSALQDALEEIRNLSAGIAPPELENTSLTQTLMLAARNHERRTGTAVTLDIDELPDRGSAALKTCVYRFAQEGLNNAFRHAEAQGQTIRARIENESLVVEVSDRGPGFPSGKAGQGSLGLAGLRDRIGTLGGEFAIDSAPGLGSRLRMTIPLAPAEQCHV